jgi:hypothetical protein
MFSSGVAVLGHQHVYDNRGDGPMEHRSKRRNSRTSDHHHPTDMIFEFAPSVSPSSSSITDFDDGDAARLPKRISIMNNIIRPIPKRVSSQFYDEAYRKGLTLQETNQAAIMAHDWHRKWTHQDEANHTMPEQDFYQSTAAGIPDSYGYNKVFDEHQGAEYVSDSDIGVDADHQFLCLEREGAFFGKLSRGFREDAFCQNGPPHPKTPPFRNQRSTATTCQLWFDAVTAQRIS